MDHASDVNTHRIAAASARKRIPVRLRMARKRLNQLALRGDCDVELSGRASTVDGALLQKFRGGRADRAGRWLRTLGSFGGGESGPVADLRAWLLVAAFALEGMGLAMGDFK